jgi:hypothetical protein
MRYHLCESIYRGKSTHYLYHREDTRAPTNCISFHFFLKRLKRELTGCVAEPHCMAPTSFSDDFGSDLYVNMISEIYLQYFSVNIDNDLDQKTHENNFFSFY